MKLAENRASAGRSTRGPSFVRAHWFKNTGRTDPKDCIISAKHKSVTLYPDYYPVGIITSASGLNIRKRLQKPFFALDDSPDIANIEILHNSQRLTKTENLLFIGD